MKCPIKFDFEGYPALKALEAFYGNNVTSLTRVINMISYIDSEGNRIPSESFAAWYNTRFEDKLDLKTENSNLLKKRIIDYYRENLPSALQGTKNDKTSNIIAKYGYESANARNDAKASVLSMILKMQRDSMFGLTIRHDADKKTKSNADIAIANERYIRAKFIAQSIIMNSKLDAKTVNDIVLEIRNANTENQVRKVLAKHGLNSNFDIYSKNNKYIQYKVKDNIKNLLIERLSSIINKNELRATSNDILKLLQTKNKTEIEEILGGENKSLADSTLLSLFYEVVPTRFINNENNVISNAEYQKLDKQERQKYKEYNPFFEELLLNSKLDFLRTENSDPFNEFNEFLAVDAQADMNETYNISDEHAFDGDTDLTIVMYDHSGTFTSAMKHVNKNVKLLLDSIPKLNSTLAVGENNEEYDYDLTNSIGLPQSMDGNTIATLLFHETSPVNLDEFVESIKRISEYKPGCEGLKVLYDYCKNDQTIAQALYTNFGKFRISKCEVQEDGGERKLVITNLKSSRIDAIRQELYASLRNSIPRLDNYLNSIECKNLQKTVLNAKSILNKDLSLTKPTTITIVHNIAKLLRAYYPNLEERGIESFIRNHKINNKVDKYENISLLLTNLDKTIQAAELSRDNYAIQLNKLDDARNKNKEKYKERENASIYGINRKEEEYIDLSTIYAEDFLSDKSITAAIELSDLLVDYTNVRVENNSINPKGNQSSDIINNSYLAGLKEILKDKVAREEFGTFKFQSRQYDFSNIMLEEIDENGDIISYGLYKKDSDGNIIPTDYCDELLDITLYNGARSYDNDKGITYNEHVEGDYLASMFTAYNTPYSKYTKKKINFGCYFLRTPADAPKNYVIKAPKYSANGLFSINNTEVITKATNEFNEFLRDHTISKNQTLNAVLDNPIKIDNSNVIITHFINRDNVEVEIPKYILQQLGVKKIDYENNDVRLKFQYTDENTEENENTYVIEGKIKDGILKGKITDIDENGLNSELKVKINNKILRNLDKQNLIERSINTKHILFKQLKKEIKQELLDAAIALDKFFVMNKENNSDNAGSLDVENGKVKWKLLERDGKKIDGAYDNYHHKGGKVIDDSSGREELVGNVFHSNKFEVWDNEQGKSVNYCEEAIKEAFDFLYGRANGKHIHIKVDENKDIIGVTLTAEQEAIIDNAITKFINHLIKDADTRLSKYENVINSDYLKYDNLAEFMLNYHLMFNNFDALVEGDSKFYKNSETFLKRAKEGQGSGVPYGIVNFRTAFNNTKTKIASPLDFYEFGAKGNKVKIQQFNKFTGVTIKNTVRYNKTTINIITEQLKNAGVEVGKAEAMMNEFKKTTVNDAQSYITLDEWVRRITARGQLNKYKSIIDKLYAGQDLNSAELTEFIQVQKNFYYNQDFNKSSKIFAPHQIKNAEFVLVPQFIQGTELEAVAKLMVKYGIDQLNTEETSKAGKTNILEIFDAKTGEVKKDILDELSDKNAPISEFGKLMNDETGRGKELYSYEFLYTQQETPQHLNETNKAGIQIMKKVLDNINPTDGNLWKAKQRFIKAYTSNIIESANNLFKELGLNDFNNWFDKSGDFITTNLKYDVFYDKLKQEIFRLGYDSNMLDYVTLDVFGKDLNGNVTVMPNYMSMIESKLESIAQSVFNNNITRQTLPGFHAAQVTNVGFNAWEGSKVDRSKVSYDKTLHYHNDGKGNYTDYVDIMIPAANFGFKRVNADGSVKPLGKIEDNGKPTPNSLLEELYDAGLQDLIGYRIPTEGKQSVCKMRVVGFIPDGCGSTIIVPDEWVAQTGSDFDIDSVYGIQYSTYIDENGKIRKHEVTNKDDIYNNSREARNNEILDCIMEIMSDPKSLEEIMGRSNFDDIKNSRKAILEDKRIKVPELTRRKDRTVYNVLDQADYQNDAMSGAKLKGFSVSRDNFCSVCNNVKPIIRDNDKITIAYSEDIISVSDATKRFGKENVKVGNGKIYITHDKLGWSNDNKNVVNRIITSYSSQTTAHILDVIKEGTIPNVNDFTFGVYKSFADIGSDYTTAISFMMQNGVKRIVDANDQTISIFTEDNAKAIPQAIKQIARELGIIVRSADKITDILNKINKSYNNEIKEIFGIGSFSYDNKDINDIVIDSEMYIRNLRSPLEGSKGLIYDLGVVLQFKKLKSFADGIGDLVRVSNPDKFGAKQTIYKTEKVLKDISELTVYDNSILLACNATDKENYLPFVQAIYPGIEKGYKHYLQNSNDEDSAYPIIHTFLKYATVPSILVNKTLFKTQTGEFGRFIDNLENYLSDNNVVTEELHNKFKKYLIGELYNQCDSLTLPVTYNEGAEKNIWKIQKPIIDNINKKDKEIKLDNNVNNQKLYATALENMRNAEKDRIFGFNRDSEALMSAEVDVPVREIVEPHADFEMQMTFDYNDEKLEKIKSNTTLEAIINGERTATTRYISDGHSNYWKDIKKGSIVKFKGKNEKYIFVRATTDIYPLKGSGLTPKQWTELEGWNIKRFDRKVRHRLHEAYQFQFEYIDPESYTYTKYKKETKEIPFNVADINRPTQEELDGFAKLTPAQKVYFIQENFSDRGIFDAFIVNLHNIKAIDGRKAGSQTITYIEDKFNKEDAYIQLADMFNHYNPLVSMAVYDLIKYAFIVEGYNMTKRGISKSLPNSILYNDLGPNGIGLIEELNNKFNKFNTLLDEIGDKPYVNFVRSHSKEMNIPLRYVARNGKRHELIRSHQNMIIIKNSEENKNLLAKYKITHSESSERYNEFVRLKFDKNEILYRIKFSHSNNNFYLYPLNLLESNEHSVFSSNPKNNNYPRASYYETIINAINNGEELSDIISSLDVEEYKYHAKVKNVKKGITLDFDNPAKSDEYLVDRIKELAKTFYKHTNNKDKRLYFINQGLEYHIKEAGTKNALYTILDIPHEGDVNKTEHMFVKIYKVKDDDIKRIIQPYLANYNEPIKDKHKDITALVSQLRDANFVELNHSVFIMVPVESTQPSIKFSRFTENRMPNAVDVAKETYSNVKQAIKQNTEDEDIIRIKKHWNDKNISLDNIEENVNYVIKSGAEVTIKRVDKISNRLKYFYQLDDGEYLSVDDSNIIDILKNDPTLEREYVNLLLEAETIIMNNQSILNIDIDAQDFDLQNQLNRVKERLRKLETNETVNKAKALYINSIVSDKSTNPLIQKDLINVLNGFYSTSWFDSWIGDIQESAHPLIQIITKEVSSELFKAEKAANKRIREFRKHIQELKEKANKEGKSINMNNIIDEYGRFIQNYDNKLIEDMNKLHDAKTEAYSKYLAKEGTYLDFLKAQLEYDEWLYKHINRNVSDNYYKEKLALERRMLYGIKAKQSDIDAGVATITEIPGFSDIYARYRELKHLREELYSHMNGDYLDPYYLEQIDKINKELSDLLNPLYRNPSTGELELRPEYYDDKVGTEEQLYHKRLHNAQANKAIRGYIDKMNKLNDKYFEKTTSHGFEEDLNKNLKIVADYERRDANGNITVPISQLSDKPEYVNAKKWIADNAKYVITEENKEELDKAKEILQTKTKSTVLKRAIKDHNARDEYGIINANLFTDEEIDEIKKEESINTAYNEGEMYNDRVLIKNGEPETVIYSRKFYEGIRVRGIDNVEWFKLVTLVNSILEPYYDNKLSIVNFDKLIDENVQLERFNSIVHKEEYKAILDNIKEIGTFSNIDDFTKLNAVQVYELLEHLYQTLNETKRKKEVSKDDVKRAIKFRKNNVSDEVSPAMQAEYDKQATLAKSKGNEYYNAWVKANKLLTEDGEVIINPYLYGSLQPKEEVKEKWIDEKRTKAVKLLNDTYMYIPTSYYYDKLQEMRKLSDEEFNKWYYRNHIFNPNTRTYQPIRCWMQQVYRDNVNKKGEWVAKWFNVESKPKSEDFAINPNYKENLSYSQNYKVGTGYDNDKLNNQNEYEVEFSNYLQDLLKELTTTEQGKKYIAEGYAPARHKAAATDGKLIAKELLKSLGWYVSETGKEDFKERIGHEYDEVGSMPFLNKLNQENAIKAGIVRPSRNVDESEEDYIKRVNEYNAKLDEFNKEQNERHKEALDNNYEEVFEQFILQAYKFNTIQENKHKLYFAKRAIHNTENYTTKYGGTSDLRKDYSLSTENTAEYQTTKDDNIRLEAQLDNWIRRIVFNQWKEPRAALTKWATRLQSITSAQYMMMNIRGGISNVNIGMVQMIAEVAANDYLSTKDLTKGFGMWNGSIVSQLADMNNDKSSNLASAIIKFFNVIDYDAIFEKSGIAENTTSKAFSTFTNLMYSPQAIGENYMQNSVLFGMLYSHKVIEEVTKEGKRIITFQNVHEYSRNCDIKALESLIKGTPLETKFEEFIQNVKKDANNLKDYAWYKKDIVTEFVKEHLPNRKQEYINAKEQLYKQSKEEFKKLPSVMDVLTLDKDGYMSIKEDSILSTYDSETIDKAIADFRGRVISVNKKLHGVYDKLGAAQVEKKWFGGLLMQYHKHLYPGLLKRWRIKGMYNESRGTIEKGYYVSLIQFLTTPIREAKDAVGMTDAEKTSIESLRQIFKHTFDWCMNIKVNYGLLPEYEKANLRRNIGDICGVLGGILAVMALRGLADDDQKESIWYNLALYEADRLASESVQFNPKGMISQAKSLWSTPIAAQSGIEDIISTMGFISAWLFDENFEPEYQTGRFAGENKFIVRLKRRIPIYRGIYTGLFDITEHNQYYKLGKNTLDNPIVEDVLNWVDPEDEE